MFECWKSITLQVTALILAVALTFVKIDKVGSHPLHPPPLFPIFHRKDHLSNLICKRVRIPISEHQLLTEFATLSPDVSENSPQIARLMLCNGVSHAGNSTKTDELVGILSRVNHKGLHHG